MARQSTLDVAISSHKPQKGQPQQLPAIKSWILCSPEEQQGQAQYAKVSFRREILLSLPLRFMQALIPAEL